MYKLSQEYFDNAQLTGKFLERAKRKRFLKISEPDKYGAVRVWVLGMAHPYTYPESFLERDTKLDDEILEILQDDYTVDLTQRNGFTQADRQRAQRIINRFESYMINPIKERGYERNRR